MLHDGHDILNYGPFGIAVGISVDHRLRQPVQRGSGWWVL